MALNPEGGTTGSLIYVDETMYNGCPVPLWGELRSLISDPAYPLPRHQSHKTVWWLSM